MVELSKRVYIKDIISAAVKSCKSFAKCSENFFGKEESNSSGGWENWLTVDIIRRLNSNKVRPFYGYSVLSKKSKQEMDFYVKGPLQIAVEIKVNYIDSKDMAKGKIVLPPRINKDFEKYKLLDKETYFLFLISTFLEYKKDLTKYKKLINSVLENRSADMKWLNWDWYDCSIPNSYNVLLAISDAARLPSEKTISKV